MVNRTFELYSSEIGKAIDQLREENPDFGRYETPKGKYIEAKYEGNSITVISFVDVKLLEAKVRELTGDSEVKLIRSGQEWQNSFARGFDPRIVTTDDSLNRVQPQDQWKWIDEMFRKSEEDQK